MRMKVNIKLLNNFVEKPNVSELKKISKLVEVNYLIFSKS
jgi:hypothetical protein